MDIDTSLGIIGKDVQEYVKLAVDEAKLKTTVSYNIRKQNKVKLH